MSSLLTSSRIATCSYASRTAPRASVCAHCTAALPTLSLTRTASVLIQVSNKGTILHNDVSGSVQVKCYLSGTPECKFGLNDKLLLDNEAKARTANNRRPGSGIEIDDVSFHQCVKLGTCFV